MFLHPGGVASSCHSSEGFEMFGLRVELCSHIDVVSVSSEHSDSGHCPKGRSSGQMMFRYRPRLATEQAKLNSVHSERIAWPSGLAVTHGN